MELSSFLLQPRTFDLMFSHIKSLTDIYLFLTFVRGSSVEVLAPIFKFDTRPSKEGAIASSTPYLLCPPYVSERDMYRY